MLSSRSTTPLIWFPSSHMRANLALFFLQTGLTFFFVSVPDESAIIGTTNYDYSDCERLYSATISLSSGLILGLSSGSSRELPDQTPRRRVETGEAKTRPEDRVRSEGRQLTVPKDPGAVEACQGTREMLRTGLVHRPKVGKRPVEQQSQRTQKHLFRTRW